jgi:hypothetical protein
MLILYLLYLPRGGIRKKPKASRLHPKLRRRSRTDCFLAPSHPWDALEKMAPFVRDHPVENERETLTNIYLFIELERPICLKIRGKGGNKYAIYF